MVCFGLGLDIDWAVVTGIGTIIMALASFAGVVFSYKSTRKSQMMWEEDNRPRVIFTVVISDKMYYLKVENIGKQIAYNIKFKVNNEFILKLPNSNLREKFIELCTKKIHLAPGISTHYGISQIEGLTCTGDIADNHEMKKHIKDLIDEQIVISGTYNNKYNISESFTMNQYTGSFVISDPTISKLNQINTSLSALNDVSENLKKISSLKKRI